MSSIILPKNRFKLIPSVYLILIKEGKILLLKRKNTGFEDGNYGLVAGHLDGNETMREGMVREAKEEAGIEINTDDLKMVHVMHRRGLGPDNERVDFFLTTDVWQGRIQNMEPKKCDDLSWFGLNELPLNIIGYTKQALDCYTSNIFYSEFGWK